VSKQKKLVSLNLEAYVISDVIMPDITPLITLSEAEGQGCTVNAKSLRKTKDSTNTTKYILWEYINSGLKINSCFWHVYMP